MTHKNFHKFFIIYFIIFGVLIASSGMAINYYLQIKEINKTIDRKAKEILQIKNEDILKNAIINMDNTLKSLSSNQVIHDYIIGKTNNINEVKHIFLAITNSNNVIMQTRFIDKDGFEIIRINRDSTQQDAYIVKA